ncbi:MAG TPA: hypothetical protein VIK86_03100 [Candidatus Paceibacterota bacterium]
MNENFIEKNHEKILTKVEVLEVMSRLAENVTFVRELSDDQGLYLLEVKVEGKKPSEIIEYMYIRKGKFPKRNESLATTIFVTYYEDGMPISGYNIANYKSESNEWVVEK